MAVVCLFTCVQVSAHLGGLNSQGCHSGSKPYHCHRASSEMVGNRLRCDLGSNSSDCIRKRYKPIIEPSNEYSSMWSQGLQYKVRRSAYPSAKDVTGGALARIMEN